MTDAERQQIEDALDIRSREYAREQADITADILSRLHEGESPNALIVEARLRHYSAWRAEQARGPQRYLARRRP